ncbi:hypothetical protein [Streptomyces mirabilis]|uniref:hypothetical protein n=1 Tax=Streptomyces mirabilis TaxID=68239 RepID=UPI0035DB74FF
MQLEHLRCEEHALRIALAVREIRNGLHPHHSHRCLTPSFRDGSPEQLVPQGQRSAQGVSEPEGSAEQGRVGKCPAKAAQLLAGVADLLGPVPEMVGAGEHLLEGQADFVQVADAF